MAKFKLPKMWKIKKKTSSIIDFISKRLKIENDNVKIENDNVNINNDNKNVKTQFNSNLNEQEKFYECLEKFFNNLSSKNPNQDEKRLWKRIVKTNPHLS